jgi:hypothetical protein
LNVEPLTIYSLPNIGPISFAELILSKNVKDKLSGDLFTIDIAIEALQQYDDTTLFYKGEKVIGHIEKYDKNKNYKRKCNVQLLLWEMTRKGTEKFTIFERVGNGKYKFVNRAKKIMTKNKKEREEFIISSRIEKEVEI